MKALLVNTVPLQANGISTFIINSAKIMSSHDINVTISAPNVVSSKLKSSLSQYGIRLIEMPNRMHNPLNYYFKLKNEMSINRYDVVHVNGNSTTMAVELLAARKSNIQLRIAHSHNTTTEHPILNKILRPVFEKNVNGRLACNAAAGKWLFKDQKYTIIKNGIFLNNYIFNIDIRKKIRNKYRISDNDILIGHVGMFNFQKNQAFLLKLLKNMDSKYKLMLIGNGPNFDDVKRQAIESGIINRIIFTGTVDNVYDYLNAFDVFALPSKFEGQPFVVIEALASGLPVVVSKNVSDEIDLTGTVRFISLNNFTEWEDSLSGLTIDSELRKSISLGNTNLLRKKGYDTENNVNKVLIPFYKKYAN